MCDYGTVVIYFIQVLTWPIQLQVSYPHCTRSTSGRKGGEQSYILLPRTKIRVRAVEPEGWEPETNIDSTVLSGDQTVALFGATQSWTYYSEGPLLRWVVHAEKNTHTYMYLSLFAWWMVSLTAMYDILLAITRDSHEQENITIEWRLLCLTGKTDIL